MEHLILILQEQIFLGIVTPRPMLLSPLLATLMILIKLSHSPLVTPRNMSTSRHPTRYISL